MVELTVVAGFLGAGKTTLLRQLIVHSLARGERCVVIENEFGSVGLDAALLARSGVPVHELNQGCVCCTLKTSFAATLANILVDPLPERIFFEPSGIFIPDNFLEIVRAPDFAGRCRVSAFITVIDARNYSVCRNKFGSFFRKQSEFADFFALSKSDALDAVALDALHAELGDVNPRAEQIRVAASDVDVASLSAMLDGGDAVQAGALPPGADAIVKKSRRSGNHRAYRPSPSAGHGVEVVTCALTAVGAGELARRLNSLADGNLGDVVRAKGRLWQGSGEIDFSLVAGLVEIAEPVTTAGEASDRRGEIVIFGTELDRAGLRALFQSPSTRDR